MTVARFGRITPLQGDMLRLAGNVLSRQSEVDVTDEQRKGTFKPEIAVPRDATAQDKLLAYTGRPPNN